MKRAWDAVAELIRLNATHRKGFKLGEVKPPFILMQMQMEMNELRESPDSSEEWADLLGILIHYAQKKGWVMDRLEDIMLMKFKERFTLDGARPLEDDGVRGGRCFNEPA